jgi:hypothetical protein
MNRQRLILFILVIIFIGAVIWSYNAMPRPETAKTLSGKKTVQLEKKPAIAAVKPTVLVDDGTRLKLDLLDADQSGFKGYRKNIFKSVFIEEVKVVKMKPTVVKQPPPVVAAPVEPLIQKPPAAPLAQFTFLGFLKKGSAKTIFLSKDNKDIILVKKGDKIAGRYEASDISDQALIITATDTGEKITIPLVENKPIAAAK